MNAETTPPAQTSLVSRLSNVLVAPGDVFAQIATSPMNHGNWIAPAVLFLAVSWLVAALAFSSATIQQELRELQRAAMQKQFQKMIDQGKMTQAQADQSIAQTEHLAGIGQVVGGVVGPIFSAGIMPFWGGFVLWAGGHLLMRRPFPFMKGVEVAGLAMTVMALGTLVRGLMCVAKGTMFTGPGVVLLLHPYDPTNQFHNALAAVEIFALWALVVKSIGLARLCSGSVTKAAVWVFGVWVVLTSGLLGIAWVAQKFISNLSIMN